MSVDHPFEPLGTLEIKSNGICAGDAIAVAGGQPYTFGTVPNGLFPVFVQRDGELLGSIVVVFDHDAFLRSYQGGYEEVMDHIHVDDDVMLADTKSAVAQTSADALAALGLGISAAVDTRSERHPVVWWWDPEYGLEEEHEHVAAFGVITSQKCMPWAGDAVKEMIFGSSKET